MSKEIDSQALEPVNKALGLAGSGDSQTELLDGIVNQTLDVGPLARRGRTIAGTEGVFRVVLRTIHAGADQQAVSMQPYSPGATGLIAPYPNPVPDSFDIWLISCGVARVSGSGDLSRAALKLTNVQQGFGLDSAGAAVVSTEVLTLAYWDDLQGGALGNAFGLTVNTWVYKHINLRIPRKGAIASPFLSFGTDASAAATFDLIMLFGLFPVSLGQDVSF